LARAAPGGLREARCVNTPLVTIGVVSYNRLHYLRALMESARECVRYPRVQWILVDGNSVEPDLRNYVESLDFVGEKVFRECTQVEAMNEIVERAEGEYLMMLPEDVQFVRRGAWLADMVELVRDHPEVGHVQFDAQRRPTLARHFAPRPRRVRSSSATATCGSRSAGPGSSPSSAPSSAAGSARGARATATQRSRTRASARRTR